MTCVLLVILVAAALVLAAIVGDWLSIRADRVVVRGASPAEEDRHLPRGEPHGVALRGAGEPLAFPPTGWRL